jgi:hypothetical protein
MGWAAAGSEAAANQYHMTAGALPGARAQLASREPLLVEGFRLMRERLRIYLAFAVACAATAAIAFPRINLLQAAASGDPLAILRSPPFNAVILLSLVALFFILPSALRQIQPSFRMTLWRTVVAILTIASVGLVTELGYAAAIVPGIILGVLLSQTLINALLGSAERTSLGDMGTTLVRAYRSSFELTRGHFATTLGVIALSLVILAVPFFLMLVAVITLDVVEPRSLVLTAPLLLLTFVYFECVRYSLIVRWYRRLALNAAPPPAAV